MTAAVMEEPNANHGTATVVPPVAEVSDAVAAKSPAVAASDESAPVEGGEEDASPSNVVTVVDAEGTVAVPSAVTPGQIGMFMPPMPGQPHPMMAAMIPPHGVSGGSPNGGAAMGMPEAMASLYVCDLADEVTEALLFEMFAQYGAIMSIRVCREPGTRRSLGYAYVNFFQRAEAENAIRCANGQPMLGRAMQVQWSLPSTLPPNTNLFIKCLDPETKPSELSAAFSEFGTVLSVKVGTNARGEGYGFVLFETAEEAKRAMDEMNGKEFHGQKIWVGYHTRRERRSNNSMATVGGGRTSPVSPTSLASSPMSPAAAEQSGYYNFTNVYVKNLPAHIDEQALQQLFSRFGPITSCAVGLDENGESRGFGFVNFEEHESAYEAIRAMNRTEIDGKTLYVGRAQKKHEREEELRRRFETVRLNEGEEGGRYARHYPNPASSGAMGYAAAGAEYAGRPGGRRPPTVNVYVKHLDDHVDEEMLEGAFAPHGAVLSTRVMRDENGVSRGFGFISYPSLEEAKHAVHVMNGQLPFEGQLTPLYVALAQRKEHRFPMGMKFPRMHMGQFNPSMMPGGMYPPPMFFPAPAPSNGGPPAPASMFFPGGPHPAGVPMLPTGLAHHAAPFLPMHPMPHGSHHPMMDPMVMAAAAAAAAAQHHSHPMHAVPPPMPHVSDVVVEAATHVEMHGDAQQPVAAPPVEVQQ